jgi:hypothetical protein
MCAVRLVRASTHRPVRFAHVAREVAEAALLRYRSPFSKHTFTQPTLLAIL